jgi:hypothetical protein
VNPFFGEGERRTFSANINIYDNEGNEWNTNIMKKLL